MRKFFVLLLVSVMVAACSFTPLYKTDDPKTEQALLQKTQQVHVEPVIPTGQRYGDVDTNSKYGIIMRNKLMELLSPFGVDSQQYFLRVQMSDPLVVRKGIQKDGSASIGSLYISATFNLTDKAGKEVFNGTVSDYSSFNILSNIYSSETSKDYATKALVESLSEDIYKRVAIYFKNN